MALNWADSSDEEDEAFFAAEHNPPVPGAEEEEEHEPSLAGDEEYEEPPPKQFVLPDRPPYTAFVGNLAFSVTEPDQLGQDIAGLVQQRFQSDIVITASRVATDRQTGKPKGFGYVEVETVEQLKVVLELNDGKSIIAGRTIHLDVAQPSQQQMRNHNSSGSSFGGGGGGRSQSFNSKNGGSGEIDASKFMGGRYNRQDSRGSDRGGGRGGGGNDRGGGRGGGNDRGDRNDRSGSFRSQGSNSGDGGAAKPAGQRPSLKLVPRGASNTSRSQSEGSSNNIFGGGKARDVGTWERGVPRKEGERRPSQRKDKDNNKGGKDGKDKNNNNKDNKGGRGGGGDRRKPTRQSSTGGRGSNNSKGEKKEESKKAAAPAPAPAPAVPEPVVAAAPAPATKKVVNKFAALDFGDSDDE